MVSISDIKKYLKDNLTRHRYRHTLNLRNLAVKLAKHYKLKDIIKIEIAALLHDCQKRSNDKNNHSFLAEKFARTKFKIKDKKILYAIKHHTFGHRHMDDFSKIIYIADMSEPSRKFPEAKEIRKLSFKDLDIAMVLALSTKIKYVIDERKPVSVGSIITYNKLLKK
ncbi:MAG: bis(5'-nucleosyl)-tetraphosphatase (symmetrical) YqeK [Elusimicrobiota bacterium]